MPTPKDTWRAGLPHETAFWHTVLLGQDQRWPGLQAERARRDRPLSASMRAMFDPAPPEGAEVHILDVGSGPLTVLGCLWEGRTLVIHPTDPLADDYNRMLDQAGLDPPFRPIAVEAERLLEHFGPDRFDMAFSHNALDHCYDPLLAIDQMLAVTRPGGSVRLEHRPNEGEFENYAGLHQWNFRAEDRAGVPHFIIAGRSGDPIDVTERLRPRATVVCHPEPNWLSVAIQRHT